MLALILAFAAYAPAHLSRGIASGNGRFHAYAIVMGADGVVRIVLCAALAVVGVKTVGPVRLRRRPVAAPGVLWVKAKGLAAHRTRPARRRGPRSHRTSAGCCSARCSPRRWSTPARSPRRFLATDDEKHLVTQFTYGVLLARIPLFLFQAVQAALLPRLSRLAARNEIAEFRSGFARLMKLVLLVGVVGTAGAFLLGPFVIERFYDATLSRQTMAMLALGSACYMVALAIAQAVIALRGHALVALGWGDRRGRPSCSSPGCQSDDLFRRVELGLVASSFAALVAFALALRSRLHSGDVPSGQSVMEAITDMPLET